MAGLSSKLLRVRSPERRTRMGLFGSGDVCEHTRVTIGIATRLTYTLSLTGRGNAPCDPVVTISWMERGVEDSRSVSYTATA